MQNIKKFGKKLSSCLFALVLVASVLNLAACSSSSEQSSQSAQQSETSAQNNSFGAQDAQSGEEDSGSSNEGATGSDSSKDKSDTDKLPENSKAAKSSKNSSQEGKIAKQKSDTSKSGKSAAKKSANSAKKSKSSSNAKSSKIKVTIKVDGSQAGKGILASSTVSLENGASVYDALCKVVTPHGSSNYVTGIGGLNEKEYGPMSGWIYTVNGVQVMKSAGSCKLKDGDNVVWTYVNVTK
jgi:cytoskeletal protein RodZ